MFSIVTIKKWSMLSVLRSSCDDGLTLLFSSSSLCPPPLPPTPCVPTSYPEEPGYKLPVFHPPQHPVSQPPTRNNLGTSYRVPPHPSPVSQPRTQKSLGTSCLCPTPFNTLLSQPRTQKSLGTRLPAPFPLSLSLLPIISLNM